MSAPYFREAGEESPAHGGDPPEVDAVGATLPVAKMDWNVFPSQRGIAFERQGERDVLHVEIVRDFRQRRLERGGAHHPVGDIGVLEIEAGEKRGRDAAGFGNEHARHAVVPGRAESEDRIGLVAGFPEGGEELGIALAVRVDLERPVCAAFDRTPISGAAGLAVPGVLFFDRHYHARIFIRELLQGGRGAVFRAIIDREHDEGDAEPVKFLHPFGDDRPNVGLFIINRHDNGKLDGFRYDT
jgi:hypothetical protein